MSKAQVRTGAERWHSAYGLAIALLVAAQVAVFVLSWLVNAVWPELRLRPLLSEEGTRWLFGHFVDNMLSPLLIWLLLCSCALSALDASGLPRALRRVRQWSSMTYRERLALRSVLGECLAAVAVMLLLTVPSHAVLLNVSGGLFPSSFSASLVPACCLLALMAALTYAVVGGEAKALATICQVLAGGRRFYWLLPLYVLLRQLWCMVSYVMG